MTETVETAPETADRERVVAGIITALGNVLEEEVPDLREDTRLADVGLDSTGVLELLMQLEETLGVEFDTDNLEMSHFESVDSLAGFVTAEMAS
ncbi:acyl carrier protein [Amycolatopsis anabasis]|uniref:acyl carrier protein n=1 Tax=Amycolatopsis anabasis TaxID=1840409 RepID=UPI00131AF1C7|nr:acyl carrier protein [Amycolatopsis anabasis]